MTYEMSVDDECALWNAGLIRDYCTVCKKSVMLCQRPILHVFLARILRRAAVRIEATEEALLAADRACLIPPHVKAVVPFESAVWDGDDEVPF